MYAVRSCCMTFNNNVHFDHHTVTYEARVAARKTLCLSLVPFIVDTDFFSISLTVGAFHAKSLSGGCLTVMEFLKAILCIEKYLQLFLFLKKKSHTNFC